MKSSITSFSILGIAALLTLGAAGCSPQAKKARLLARADREFAAGHYDAAEIDYLTALRADRLNPHAIGRLGVIYFDQGRVGKCFPFLTEGRRLEPDNLELRLRLGLYFLSLGQFEEATKEANFILQQKPANEAAPLLLAEAAVRPDAMAAARRNLEHLPASAAGGAPVLVALGTLDFRERHFAAAESRFRAALALDPKSSDADTALAALDWAEKNLPAADQAFARAAALAPARSAKKLQYAEFKIQNGDRPAARELLEKSARKTPDFLPAIVLLAELDEAEKKYDASSVLVAKVLARDPAEPEALLLSGRLKLAAGRPEEAVAGLEKAEKIYPHYARLEFELAQAYLAGGAAEKAKECLNRAVRTASDFPEAVILLAQVDLQTGDAGAAVAALKTLLQRRPDLTAAQPLLAAADLAQNNLDDALALYRQIAAASPRDPQPVLAEGLILLREARPAEARRDFEQALALSPDYFPALQKLVELDLAGKQYAAARRRSETLIAKNPAQPEAYILLSRVCLAEHDVSRAEAALHQALRLHPDSPDAYFLLAGIHADANHDEDALADLNQIVARNPKDTRALMLIGLIQEKKKNYPAAQDAYEKVLAADPNFSAALNNLAYLDSEYLGQSDRAFALAQRARALLPNEPHVADTLGWILYKRGQYPWALALLKESADNLPNDASNEFHLGLTYSMLGDEGLARSRLEQALRLKPDFSGADSARRHLSALAVDPATAGPAERASLEKLETAEPGDPVVLGRLAAIYQREGARDRAVALLEAALRSNPKREPTLLQLAQLYAAGNQTAQALAMAKAAHELAPDDAEAAHTLGLLAYGKADYAWSASLLKEAADKQPDNPDAAFDLGQAEYRLGRVDDAAATMRRALDASAPFSRRESARSFLGLIDIAAHPSAAASARVEAALQKDPADLAALMAAGAIAEQGGKLRAAQPAYEKALERDPDFSPAQRQGGFIAYRLGNYRRAAVLLTESLRQDGGDAELMFYLGMARCQLKDKSGRETLRRAVSLNLPPDLAAQARRVLAE